MVIKFVNKFVWLYRSLLLNSWWSRMASNHWVDTINFRDVIMMWKCLLDLHHHLRFFLLSWDKTSWVLAFGCCANSIASLWGYSWMIVTLVVVSVRSAWEVENDFLACCCSLTCWASCQAYSSTWLVRGRLCRWGLDLHISICSGWTSSSIWAKMQMVRAGRTRLWRSTWC